MLQVNGYRKYLGLSLRPAKTKPNKKILLGGGSWAVSLGANAAVENEKLVLRNQSPSSSGGYVLASTLQCPGKGQNTVAIQTYHEPIG